MCTYVLPTPDNVAVDPAAVEEMHLTELFTKHIHEPAPEYAWAQKPPIFPTVRQSSSTQFFLLLSTKQPPIIVRRRMNDYATNYAYT